jgi:hypothetical protein
VEVFRRFRLMTVRIALLLTTVAAAIAYTIDLAVMKGLLLGALSGIVMFWIIAVRMEKTSLRTEGRAMAPPVSWRMVELAIYLASLYRAYLLDPDRLYAFFAAAGGLFIIRGAVFFLGLTSLDMKNEKDE